MNIMTQVCGIAILITLIIFFVIQKKLYLGAEKRYLGMLLLMLLVHILDILSLFAIQNNAIIPKIVLDMACKGYCISLQLIVISAFLYVSQDIFKRREIFVKMTKKYVIAIAVAAMCVVILPFEYVNSDVAIYTSGPAVYLTFFSVFVFIIFIILRLYKHSDKINPDRRSAVLIWMCAWVLAAFIQFIFPELLIASFAGSIGMMILYIKLENPGISIDKQSGLFTQSVLTEYINSKFETDKTFAMISFQLDNVANVRHGNYFSWENVLDSFGLKKGIIFRESKYEGVIVFNNESDAKEWQNRAFDALKDDNSENGLCLKRAHWTSIYNSKIFNSPDELLNFYRYASNFNVTTTNEDGMHYVVADYNIIEQMRNEKKMERLIDDAIANDKVEVFYQPIFSTFENRFTTAEALVRLRDENGQIVPPGLFIPIAEKTGKIIALGEKVFDKVCRFISERELHKIGIDYIEINLSVVQCDNELLADNCIDIMKKYNVDSNKINLEITESAELKQKDVFMNNLNKLRNYGISFSLDDFGTGHSNLNYIVDMSVDIVKFDRSMISAFFNDEKAHYVMEAAMHMIHGMGLKIVSEGIETVEQFNKIKDMGIAYIQGFYFSKPIPENEFYEFVRQNNFVSR